MLLGLILRSRPQAGVARIDARAAAIAQGGRRLARRVDRRKPPPRSVWAAPRLGPNRARRKRARASELPGGGGGKEPAISAQRWAMRRASSARGGAVAAQAVEPVAQIDIVAAEAALGQHGGDLGGDAAGALAAAHPPSCARAAAAAAGA